MAVTKKLADRLKAFDSQNKYAKEIAELKAAADKKEAEGFKGEHTHIRKEIFKELVKLQPGRVEWIEPHFERSEVTIEEYTDYSKDAVDGVYPTLKKPSISYGWAGGNFRFIGPLSGMFSDLSIQNEYAGSYGSWHSKPNGKVRIYVGSDGRKEQFKQRKDGTHRYADIAQAISHNADRYIHNIKQERARNKNQDAVKQVLSMLDAKHDHYNGLYLFPNASTDKPVTIKIDKTISLTVEQAVELANTLKKLGIG